MGTGIFSIKFNNRRTKQGLLPLLELMKTILLATSLSLGAPEKMPVPFFSSPKRCLSPFTSHILEEKAFTYQVNLSFDGTNWISGASLPVQQTITVKIQATGTNAVSSWVGYPNLQGGNVFTNGMINPMVTASAVQAIVGSTNFTIDPSANTP
jgi:hypothetical protein